MIFNKKSIDIFWINRYGMTLMEYGDIDVGDTFSENLTFSYTEMEPSESVTKSLKRIDINRYEGVGRIFNLAKDNGPTLLFDCGIYAVCHDATLPEGIESGSYVKMRFYLGFDEGYANDLRMNGEVLFKVIPEMYYDWRVKDILIHIEGEEAEKNFAQLPVAYTSSKGEIYKRIRGTFADEDCSGYDGEYILICEML